MSSGGDAPGERSTEERAEEVVERVTHDVSRWVTRFLGRAREEVEDVVAEARSLNERGWSRGAGDPRSDTTPASDAPDAPAPSAPRTHR